MKYVKYDLTEPVLEMMQAAFKTQVMVEEAPSHVSEHSTTSTTSMKNLQR